MGGKSKTLMLMAAFKINQEAKTRRKNKYLKMMLQVARIGIRKRKNVIEDVKEGRRLWCCPTFAVV